MIIKHIKLFERKMDGILKKKESKLLHACYKYTYSYAQLYPEITCFI